MAEDTGASAAALSATPVGDDRIQRGVDAVA
jgi:hypothetical protein